MASNDSNRNNNNKDDGKPSRKPDKGVSETKQASPNVTSSDFRIPYAIQIGQPRKIDDIMSGKAEFQAKGMLVKPTVSELVEQCRAHLESKDPLELTKPNNGFPAGSCAGCGSEKGKDGGNMSQCARWKDRRYCGRDRQKKDWSKHKAGCKPV